jgi:hypothetical protein
MIKLIKLSFGVFLLSLHFVLAQKDSAFYFYDNLKGLQYAKSIEFKTPLFGEAHLLVNSKEKFPILNIKYFNNEEGFFLKNTLSFSEKEFLKRESKGKIDTYSKWSYSGGYYNAGTGMYSAGAPVKQNFYTKENFEIKKTTINNLAIDLSDNALSMEAINGAKIARNVQIGLYVAGALMIVGGIAVTVSSRSVTPGMPIVGVGVAALAFTWIPFIIVENKKQKAIDIYNQ